MENDTQAQSGPPMKAGIVPVTPLQQNCSLIWCTKTNKGALIDPGGDLDKLKAAVAKSGVELEKILITHGHMDHCGEAGVLAKELGLTEGPHEADRFWIARLEEDGAKYGMNAEVFEPDRWLVDGDTVTVGELMLEVIHCPATRPACRGSSTARASSRWSATSCSGQHRTHRFPDGQPPGFDRRDHAETVAAGR